MQIFLRHIMMLLLVIPSISFSQIPEKLRSKVLPAVVEIQLLSNTAEVKKGTGFFIGKSTIISCFHVFHMNDFPKITNQKGQVFTVDSVLASSRACDMIILRVKEKSGHYLKINPEVSDTGTMVYYCGHPNDESYAFAGGRITDKRRVNNLWDLTTDIRSYPGSSGGPLFDHKAKVCGIMYVGSYRENVSLAMSVHHAIDLVDDNEIQSLQLRPSKMDSTEVEEFMLGIGDYVAKANYIGALTLLELNLHVTSTNQLIRWCYYKTVCCYELKRFESVKPLVDRILWSFIRKDEKTGEEFWMLNQCLSYMAFTYYEIGDEENTLQTLETAITACEKGYSVDNIPERYKDGYALLLQDLYMTKGNYYVKKSESEKACINYRMAKKYGSVLDEPKFRELCGE